MEFEIEEKLRRDLGQHALKFKLYKLCCNRLFLQKHYPKLYLAKFKMIHY
jgi:hypothetical protein